MQWHAHSHHFVIRIARTTCWKTEFREARLITVHVKEDELVEHPVEILIVIKLYLEVVRSWLVKVDGGNTA